MIKVIASDMDGTLLGDDHRIAPETLAAIRRACDAGIRFMVATGRNFPGAMEELKGTDRYRYYVKKTSSYEKALEFQQEVRKTVKDCFIIAVYKGKQITVAEARKLEQKK